MSGRMFHYATLGLHGHGRSLYEYFSFNSISYAGSCVWMTGPTSQEHAWIEYDRGHEMDDAGDRAVGGM